MGRIGFWQLLLDDNLSYWEAQKINEASDAADVAQSYAYSAQQSADASHARINQMSREIVMLRTALTVLANVLEDAKVIDGAQLDAKYAAAVEAAFPKPPQQPAPVPASEIKYTCLKCRQQVLASTTLMTADGPVCERCPPPPATPYR
ncbi:MAG TPA: hypothetical protein VM513_24620 [Kofleriaceae bacterium]|jgi:hypothetical protein|nr:hypothetical protein [Kofleriaceae bacterium]